MYSQTQIATSNIESENKKVCGGVISGMLPGCFNYLTSLSHNHENNQSYITASTHTHNGAPIF